MAKTLQLLRNAEVYADKATALSILQTKLLSSADGEMVLARYTNGDEGVETLISVAYNNGTDTGYTIVDTVGSETEVEELQSQIDSILGDGDIDEAYDTIAEIASALTTLNADEDTEGSVAYAVAQEEARATAAEEALEAALEAAEKALTVSSSDGSIVVDASTEGTDITVNIDNETIVKDDSGVLSVASSALTQYVGSDAIAVSGADDDNNKTISLTINASDAILSQDSSGLLSTLSLVYDSTNKEIYLYGKDTTTAISTIDATDFIKDGMIESAELIEATSSDTSLTEGHKYIKLTFNDDGGDTIYLDVNDLVDVYTGGNGISVDESNVISVVIDGDSETFLTVSASGLKLSGVQDAINSAADTIKTAVGLSDDGEYVATSGTYTSTATTVMEAISLLETQVSSNTESISNNADSVSDTIEALDMAEVGGTGYMVTTVSQTDGQVSATAIEASASNISATASSATDTAVAVEGTTVADQITSLATSIQTVADTAIEPVGSNGIDVTTESTSATISIIIDPDDEILEVGENGLKVSEDAVIDCGDY